MAEQKSSQQLAVEKLQGELKKETDKTFAELIIEHLIQRVQEDAGFAEDVLKEDRTYQTCGKYIFSMAQKAGGSKRQIAIRNDTVFEWAEDYYRMENAWQESKPVKTTVAVPKASKDTSGEKQTPKPTKTVTKPQKTDKKQQNIVSAEPEDKPAPEEKPKEKKEPKKKSADISGQLSLFDLM